MTLEHNAKACMESLVKYRIWPRLRDEPLMWCSATTKPILDMSVYSKNRCGRVPGSTKWPEPPSRCLPLPPWDFFNQTRMADRPGCPTWNTEELDIWNCSRLPQLRSSFQNEDDSLHTKMQSPWNNPRTWTKQTTSRKRCLGDILNKYLGNARASLQRATWNRHTP